MTRRKTDEEAKEIVEKHGFIFVESYVGKEETRVVMKDQYGYKYDISLKDFLNKKNKVVKFVHIGNRFSLENIKLWIRLKHKDFEVADDYVYINSKEKINFICRKCGESFASSWNDIHAGKGCSFCARKKIVERNSFGFLFPELLEEWDYSNNTIDPYKVFPKSSIKASWVCKVCGNCWKTSVAKRTHDKTGCPICKSSKGENRIFNWLKENGILFSSQKIFLDCKLDSFLPFDFYLPEYNLCIEYDGILHYEDKFNNPKEFKLTKKRDKIKTKYCKSNNINLLRIPYWEFDNIEKILEKTLSELR